MNPPPPTNPFRAVVPNRSTSRSSSTTTTLTATCLVLLTTLSGPYDSRDEDDYSDRDVVFLGTENGLVLYYKRKPSTTAKDKKWTLVTTLAPSQHAVAKMLALPRRQRRREKREGIPVRREWCVAILTTGNELFFVSVVNRSGGENDEEISVLGGKSLPLQFQIPPALASGTPLKTGGGGSTPPVRPSSSSTTLLDAVMNERGPPDSAMCIVLSTPTTTLFRLYALPEKEEEIAEGDAPLATRYRKYREFSLPTFQLLSAVGGPFKIALWYEEVLCVLGTRACALVEDTPDGAPRVRAIPVTVDPHIGSCALALPAGRLLVTSRGGIGAILDLQGNPLTAAGGLPVVWPSPPVHLALAGPYVLALLADGSLSVSEADCPSRLLQSMSLPAPSEGSRPAVVVGEWRLLGERIFDVASSPSNEVVLHDSPLTRHEHPPTALIGMRECAVDLGPGGGPPFVEVEALPLAERVRETLVSEGGDPARALLLLRESLPPDWTLERVRLAEAGVYVAAAGVLMEHSRFAEAFSCLGIAETPPLRVLSALAQCGVIHEPSSYWGEFDADATLLSGSAEPISSTSQPRLSLVVPPSKRTPRFYACALRYFLGTREVRTSSERNQLDACILELAASLGSSATTTDLGEMNEEGDGRGMNAPERLEMEVEAACARLAPLAADSRLRGEALKAMEEGLTNAKRPVARAILLSHLSGRLEECLEVFRVFNRSKEAGDMLLNATRGESKTLAKLWPSLSEWMAEENAMSLLLGGEAIGTLDDETIARFFPSPRSTKRRRFLARFVREFIKRRLGRANGVLDNPDADVDYRRVAEWQLEALGNSSSSSNETDDAEIANFFREVLADRLSLAAAEAALLTSSLSSSVSPWAIEVRVALLRRLKRHRQALKAILLELRSQKRAEDYCAEVANAISASSEDSASPRENAYPILLAVMLEGAAVGDAEASVRSFLSRHAEEVDPLESLASLSDTTAMTPALTAFLSDLVLRAQTRRREARVRKALARAENLKARVDLTERQKRYVVVSAGTKCKTCGKGLRAGEGLQLLPPLMHVAHYPSCLAAAGPPRSSPPPPPPPPLTARGMEENDDQAQWKQL